jgi:hypothetical protein
MLVNNIEAVDSPECCYTIPSAVWFESIDKANSIRAKDAYFSFLSDAVERFPVLPDREGDSFKIRVGVVAESESAREMVERGTQVMNGVPDCSDDAVGNNCNVVLGPHHFIDSVRLILRDKSIALERVKAFDEIRDLQDVLIGPL